MCVTRRQYTKTIKGYVENVSLSKILVDISAMIALTLVIIRATVLSNKSARCNNATLPNAVVLAINATYGAAA